MKCSAHHIKNVVGHLGAGSHLPMSALLMKALTNVFMSSNCSPAFNRNSTSTGFLHGTVQRYAHKLKQAPCGLNYLNESVFCTCGRQAGECWEDQGRQCRRAGPDCGVRDVDYSVDQGCQAAVVINHQRALRGAEW